MGGGKSFPRRPSPRKKEEGPSPPRSEVRTVDWNNVAEGAGLVFFGRPAPENKKEVDSPENNVMLSGFPPNAAALSCIHLTATRWSSSPAFPSTPPAPERYRKPSEATRYCSEATMTFSSAARMRGSYTSSVEVPP